MISISKFQISVPFADILGATNNGYGKRFQETERIKLDDEM